MPEWLVENGIGEERAILADSSRIIAARVSLPGEVTAGHVYAAKLVERTLGSNRGKAQLDDGSEVLVSKLPSSLSEGSPVSIQITRGSVGERGRFKLPQGIVSDRHPCQPGLMEMLRSESPDVREVHAFPMEGWDDLIGDALARNIAFEGGNLLIDPTPAMMMMDVDGYGNPLRTALAAVDPIAEALAQFDIGGVIGIDFPTIASKAERKTVDDALAAALAYWPHERTAMNGFGFVQIVARMNGPSLIHRATFARVGLLTRQLLRRAERVDEPGALLLTLHPALRSHLKPEWLKQLARRTGREIRVKENGGLALEGAFAQAVAL